MNALQNFDDFRARAKRRLPRMLFEYIDRGSEDEQALRTLRRGLDAIRLAPRVLTGLDAPDTHCQYLDQACPLPLVIAPTGLAGLVCHDGEAKLARAAGRAGLPFTVSTQSVTTIEAIRAAAPDATLWFQLYLWRDRRQSYALLERVRRAGVATLVVTVDTPIAPNREYNVKNGFGVPFRASVRAAADVLCHPAWFVGVLLRCLLQDGMPSYGHYPKAFRHNILSAAQSRGLALENRLTWEDVQRLRDVWPGRIIVKGILHRDDAAQAVAAGMDGIVVSSHGGRNLDCAVAPVEVLADIVAAVNAAIPVFADSGVRRGSDVAKYLALGATAVWIGRAPLWGLAAAGEAGADWLLQRLAHELQCTMTLLGAADLAALRTLDRIPDHF